ncbi:hypothetical protein VST7929_01307 [Vibrio stylophorae]|uniref:DNA mismatch repair protein n=1 Tax=Vibrio stylophorae TaxID=659351 RepID=A0ABM8ZSZ8_9VIBR|nr:DNA mismatch repair protein [Vibrio stylophorae]CAH0533439.1 hypothetical protein VST7929_01307 [Vibrio stylophorae]
MAFSIQRIPVWLFILLGLLLNIVAILISSVILEQYNQRNQRLHEQQTEYLDHISQAWRKVENLERKREWTWLMMQRLAANQDAKVTPTLIAQLQPWLNQPLNNISYQSLFQLIDQDQQQLREKIDTAYIETLTIKQRLQTNSQNAAYLHHLALFLQILGLTLLLARDLLGHRHDQKSR